MIGKWGLCGGQPLCSLVALLCGRAMASAIYSKIFYAFSASLAVSLGSHPAGSNL